MQRIMTTMSDLPQDLVEEKILPRVPITSLRSTSKKWNILSKSKIFVKALVEAVHPFMGFMLMGSRVCSLRFNLQEIRKDALGDLVGPSIKQVSNLDQVDDIRNIFYCNGLLLCVIEYKSRLLVWNPYLGQTRWIQPRDEFYYYDKYALGYDNNLDHKILRVWDDYSCRSGLAYEIYNFKSNSWKVLDFTPAPDLEFSFHQRGMVSIKGNTYLLVQEKMIMKGKGEKDKRKIEAFLLCFDYTTESFGPRLPLPFRFYEEENMALSCVREEQLAVLYQNRQTSEIMEIWTTTKIEPNAVLWSSFFKVDMRLLDGFVDHCTFFRVDYFDVVSFFIDEEKKVAVVFEVAEYRDQSGSNHYDTTCDYNQAHIIGKDKYFETVYIEDEGRKHGYAEYRRCFPLVCSTSYVRSLVQLQIKQPGKRKEREY